MKKGIILILLVLISPISLAQELKPGKLWINGVEIPYEKGDFEDLFENLEESFKEKTVEKKSISYVYANGQRIAKVENNEVFYFHNDHLGSPVAITNSSGNVIWQADYLPFGGSFNEVSFDGGSNVKYNSKELDKDIDLHYYGARYYNAPTGRFITADTIKGELVDPQSLNLYVYTLNNPMKYIDPSGNTVLGGPMGKQIAENLKESEERAERGWQQIRSRDVLKGAINFVLGKLGAADPIGLPVTGTVTVGSKVITQSSNVVKLAQKYGVSERFVNAIRNFAKIYSRNPNPVEVIQIRSADEGWGVLKTIKKCGEAEIKLIGKGGKENIEMAKNIREYGEKLAGEVYQVKKGENTAYQVYQSYAHTEERIGKLSIKVDVDDIPFNQMDPKIAKMFKDLEGFGK